LHVIVVIGKRISMLTLNAFILALLMNSSPSSQGLKDNELKPYVSTFIELSGKLNRLDAAYKAMTVKIRFGNPGKGNLAACFYMMNEVTVDKTAFTNLLNENKEELILHELGHCALDLMHSEDGIMRATGLYNPKSYRDNYTKLVNDLFGIRPKNYIKIEYDPSKYSQGKTMSRKAEILSNKHAVVRFTATWCPPCKALAPIFDEVAAANPDVVTYVVDVDQNRDLASEMGIRGLPTMLQIKDGKVEATLVGAQPKPEVERLFK